MLQAQMINPELDKESIIQRKKMGKNYLEQIFF